MNNKISTRTKHTYGWGCIGRDMCYNIVNTGFLLFLTDAIGLTAVALATVNFIMMFARIWDAINDPMMGTIVDNTKSKWGKFKPWILIGAISNAIVVILMFMNFKTEPNIQAVIYGALYILWGMTFTMNDISYWSMLPSLTTDPIERSKVGTITNIAASIGQFTVIAALSPVTNLISNALAAGSTQISTRGENLATAFFICAIVVAVIFVLCQLMTVFGVKEAKTVVTGAEHKHTGLKEMFKIIKGNDQLLILLVVYVLFNVGYFTTTGMGMYYFNFAMADYGVGSKFMIFSIILAVSTIATMAFYPTLSRRFTKKKLFTIGIICVLVGYVGLFSAGIILPLNMIILGVAGAILFFGSSTISMLIIMMFADTVEYGQWKIGTRNESINYSLRPFGVKLASAVSGFIVGQTLIISKLNLTSNELGQLDQSNPQYMTFVGNILAGIEPSQIMIMRLSMTILPIILILIAYIFFMKKFDLDKDRYALILKELEERETKKLAEK